MIDLQFGLDYVADDNLTGYRLERLEVLNWGTFNRVVWTLHLGGRNSLLTGDIGTGKSTLVDAVTTLLVPAHRVAYNKAAGAASRERTLRSYVLGHYKAERGASDDSSARPVALRDNNSYSVILGVFKNVGYMQTVTLAQVFWATDRARQPRRFYVGAERDMSIADDFSRFGTEIVQLRRRLRQRHVTIWDTFPPYGAWFRRRFGIHNKQALELFHQTVSMKSVGNLTDFVRSHMLERFDSTSQIDDLIGHFDDLTRAHEAVLKAKRQIALLTPLVKECDHYDALADEIRQRIQCDEALEPYFAGLKLELLERRIVLRQDERTRETAAIGRCETRRASLGEKIDSLKSSIANSGGDRLSRLDSEIRERSDERDRRAYRAERFAELLRTVDEQQPEDEDTFLSQRSRLVDLREESRSERERVNRDVIELGVAARHEQNQWNDLSSEISSLKSRRTNIPSEQVELRQELCLALDLEEATLPYAGELISVRDQASEWEGVAERLLRGFALSLLVADTQYALVADWVDKNHLGARVVYFRVRDRRGHRTDPHRDSLVRKLSIKKDSPFCEWLERELERRFDMACCSNREQFLLEPSAVTKAGQIKEFGERHEKDDRFRIDDRARYVLGWTNAAKLNALEEVKRSVNARLTISRQKLRNLDAERQNLQEKIETLSQLRGFSDYKDVDWRTVVSGIASLIDERKELESASDVLKPLRAQLARAEFDFDSADKERDQRKAALAVIEDDFRSCFRQKRVAQSTLHGVESESLKKSYARLERIQCEVLGTEKLTIESCDKAEKRISKWLSKRIRAGEGKLVKRRDEIIRLMMKFNEEYSLETTEIDASIESAPDYRHMLRKLHDDDLPSFETRFKKLLNENTIREIANFQALLDRKRETIKDRIALINESLSQIPYNRNRYIRLEERITPDREIAEFRRQLRTCTEGTLTGSESDQYSEGKFEEVKKVIERFRGREGQAEQDRRWTAKVTDVRNWFVFGASERQIDDDSEYEHYSDSSGKSGGQKEKLAYTILAASLTYQFGLEWGSVRSRSFRFVVIDEAFGRGSDESAQFALTLFSKLNLQILIVTPLQKIYVIEPFVESVGFVDIKNDRDSRLRNLSITQYQYEKKIASKLRRS